MAFGETSDCPRCKAGGVSVPMTKCFNCGNVYCGRCNPGKAGQGIFANKDHRICPRCGSDRTRQGG